MMFYVLTIAFSFSGAPVESNLMNVLITMTTLITYFMIMDKRDLEKRLVLISGKVDNIEDTCDATWDILMSEDDDLTDEEIEELIEDLQIQLIHRRED